MASDAAEQARGSGGAKGDGQHGCTYTARAALLGALALLAGGHRAGGLRQDREGEHCFFHKICWQYLLAILPFVELLQANIGRVSVVPESFRPLETCINPSSMDGQYACGIAVVVSQGQEKLFNVKVCRAFQLMRQSCADVLLKMDCMLCSLGED